MPCHTVVSFRKVFRQGDGAIAGFHVVLPKARTPSQMRPPTPGISHSSSSGQSRPSFSPTRQPAMTAAAIDTSDSSQPMTGICPRNADTAMAPSITHGDRSPSFANTSML